MRHIVAIERSPDHQRYRAVSEDGSTTPWYVSDGPVGRIMERMHRGGLDAPSPRPRAVAVCFPSHPDLFYYYAPLGSKPAVGDMVVTSWMEVAPGEPPAELRVATVVKVYEGDIPITTVRTYLHLIRQDDLRLAQECQFIQHNRLQLRRRAERTLLDLIRRDKEPAQALLDLPPCG